jgi:hypothetical protein
MLVGVGIEHISTVGLSAIFWAIYGPLRQLWAFIGAKRIAVPYGTRRGADRTFCAASSFCRRHTRSRKRWPIGCYLSGMPDEKAGEV